MRPKLTPSQIKLAVYVFEKEIKFAEERLEELKSEPNQNFYKDKIKDFKALISFIDPAGVFIKKEGF